MPHAWWNLYNLYSILRCVEKISCLWNIYFLIYSKIQLYSESRSIFFPPPVFVSGILGRHEGECCTTKWCRWLTFVLVNLSYSVGYDCVINFVKSQELSTITLLVLIWYTKGIEEGKREVVFGEYYNPDNMPALLCFISFNKHAHPYGYSFICFYFIFKNDDFLLLIK